MNWYKQAQQKHRVKVGKTYWFEYHCFESPKSCDAKLWYHSHQKVKVLSMVEKGYGKNDIERGENGEPAVFKVQFADGMTYDAFEDEILNSTNDFTQEDPPKAIQNELV